jgi:hypothetical protein
MAAFSELVDLETQVLLKKAAPQVMQVPWDTAQMVVRGLQFLSLKQHAHKDAHERVYWEETLKNVSRAGKLPEETSMMLVGKICRSMGLTLWREADGYHAAWSEAQLTILKKYFGV